MAGNTIREMAGITGVIKGKSTFNEWSRAEVLVDEPWRKKYKDGVVRILCDDVLELAEDDLVR